jgi:hypothetical protein
MPERGCEDKPEHPTGDIIMRMLMNVELPLEPFNTAVRNGTVGDIVRKILEDCKPESVYFTEQHGRRGAVLVVQVERECQIPALAEPWFLQFQAHCEFRIAMTPEDLEQAGLQALGKKWG